MMLLLVKKADAWLKQNMFVGLLIRLIVRWKNCTRAETLVQFFPHKIEQMNRPTRHVFLHKQSRRWFETPSPSLLRHCNERTYVQ